MQTNRTKAHKGASNPFSLEITDNRLLVNVNLPRRRTLIVLGTLLAGSPILAELLKALLNLH